MPDAVLSPMQRSLADADPEIAGAIRDETRRQSAGLELIASENFVSAAVLEATGSVLTNKYAEGYPGKRYYGGCEFVDVAESLAIARAKALFGAEHVNVQPHSGANANLAAYLALIDPGDRILGLSLAEGGHLTHGLAVNFSGRLFEAHFYGVDQESGMLDYDVVAQRAREVRPRAIIAGASAYSRSIDYKRFREIADEVGALLPADRPDPSQPATDFEYVDGGGLVGFINPVSQPFCGDCNRLRLTADGKVRNCLFSLVEWDARVVMRNGGSDEALAQLVRDSVAAKKPGHGIEDEGFLRPERAMYQIGG